MSVETILSRMISDSAFAEAVFANAEKALAEYKLSAEEIAKFTGLTRAHFESMLPEDRKSFLIVGRSAAIGDPQDNPPGSRNHNETNLTL